MASTFSVMSIENSLFFQRPIEAITSTQPTSPSTGDTCILGVHPTGTEWSNFNEDDIVIYNGSSWSNITPRYPVVVFLKTANKLYLFDGAGWDVL